MLKRIAILVLLVVLALPMLANAWTMRTRVLTTGGQLEVTANGITQPPQTTSAIKAVAVTNPTAASVACTPNSGFEISSIRLNGVYLSGFNAAGDVIAVPYSAAKSIQILDLRFTKAMTSVTATSGAGGSVYPAGTFNFAAGSVNSFTFTPAAGNQVLDIEGLSGLTYDPSPLSFPIAGPVTIALTVPNADVTLNGVFKTIFADAGPAQVVLPATEVTLDASASTGDAVLTYLWTQTNGATVTLDDATLAQPKFTSLSAGDNYAFKVDVSSGGITKTAYTTVSVFTTAKDAAQAHCQNCHGAYGFSEPFDNWSTSLHEANYVMCFGCHIGTNTGGHPGTPPSANTCQGCHGEIHGSQYPNCLSCHEPHSLVTNIDHVQLGYVTGGTTLCLKCHDPGAGENSTVNVTHIGNCALCHTNDPSLLPFPNLQPGVPLGGGDCITCHTSDWTAVHKIACLDCHDQPQDNLDGIPLNGRRAVAGEFPSGAIHAHFANSTGPTNTDCLACHNLTNHTDGKVKLNDADTGTLYEFQVATDLTSDPDLSNFCMSCHDSDGAMRLTAPLDPFANGNVPPDVATRFNGTLQWNEWSGDYCFGAEGSKRPVNSHHDISNADQAFSGAQIECLDCHGAHTSAASQKLTDPFEKNVPWTGTLNQFCLTCHKGEHLPTDPNMPSTVSMPTYYTEPPPEVPGENCGPGLVYDCAGNCVTQTAVDANLTNASCDDYGMLDLDCSAFRFDGGDCRPVNTPNTSCGPGLVYDCADNCVAQTTIDTALGGTCDEALGLDLNCTEFNYDNFNNYNKTGCNPCIGNNCSFVGGIDSCDYDIAPWYIEYPWSNEAHGDGSKRQWPGYSGLPTVPAMDCVACHEAHGSYDAVTNPGGNPYMLRDYVDGTQFTDDGIRKSPSNVPGTAGPVVITNPATYTIGPQLGAQFCAKCHAKWVGAYSWHSYCSGCLTCHSHGQAFGGGDFGGGANDAAPLLCP